jgi:predicted dehydrogenase
MPTPIRVGILGLTHDHIWGNLDDLSKSSLGKLVAAADPNGPLLEKIRDEYGCKQVFDSYEDMLDEATLDAVYVYGDNKTGAELTVMAAERGLDVMVEKPMASTLEGAVAMVAAAKSNGVKLMINWPFAWSPALQKAMGMALGGEIGQVFETKYRSAHAGPKELGCTPYFYNWLHDAELNGAGALMDYCCYGAALARYVLGQPSRVTGVAGQLLKDYITLEDNAVILMQWPRAMAVTEASWSQIGHLTSYETVIYGSEGTLFVERSGRLLLATREHDEGIVVEVPELSAEESNASAYFLHCIANDLPIEGICRPEVGRDAQEILEAGLLAATYGETISLPLPVYG